MARAEVVPRRLSNSYQFLSSERSVLGVSFFEVREGYRRHGHGQQFAHQLAETYKPTELIAFSHRADDFWQHLITVNDVTELLGDDYASFLAHEL